MCERDGIDTIADNDVISRLNEKITEEGLDHKYLPEITIKYHSNHRKYRYEIGNKSRKQHNRTSVAKKLAIKKIMDCRTTLGLKQYDVILTKEQWELTKIMISFKGENMQTQYNILGYRIGLYFHNYKLAVEIDENGYSNRNIGNGIKRKKHNRTRTWL